MDHTQSAKKCIVCEKELNRWKQLFCSDDCCRQAHLQIRGAKDFVKSETDLANDIIKLRELLGEKAEILDECRRQLAEEVQLEMCRNVK